MSLWKGYGTVSPFLGGKIDFNNPHFNDCRIRFHRKNPIWISRGDFVSIKTYYGLRRHRIIMLQILYCKNEPSGITGPIA